MKVWIVVSVDYDYQPILHVSSTEEGAIAWACKNLSEYDLEELVEIEVYEVDKDYTGEFPEIAPMVCP